MSSNLDVKNQSANNFHHHHNSRDVMENSPDRDQATQARTLNTTKLDKEDCSDSDEISNQSSVDNGLNSANCSIELTNNNNNVINNTTNNLSKETKVEKIRDCINQCISDKSKKKISSIINNVIELTDIEKVYLYLNLPTGSCQEMENSKLKSGPGNPFGKKADIEVSQTYIWIASHLEEDSTVSLPKHEVYEEYKLFCESNSSQPLCVADFGKAMKHMFPNVKPRRLGQRGNSRYCYSGLRKKINFERPELPDLYGENNPDSSIISKCDQEVLNKVKRVENHDQIFEDRLNILSNDKNLVLSASSHIILEWARKVHSLKFETIKDLAKHLVLLNYIDKESIAALTVIASDEDCRDDLSELSNVMRSSDNLTFKKLLSTDSNKKQMKKKDQIKLVVNKKTNDQLTGKMVKSSKAKKNRIKKHKSMSSRIKLESFDNLTGQTSNLPTNDELSINPIEINKTKNSELDNQFIIDNTQPVDLNLNNSKRRHSTIGFESNYLRMTSDQSDTNGAQIVDNKNYKQIKRQTSEHFALSKKRNMNKLDQPVQHQFDYYSTNQASTNDLNPVQSTNYLNETTAKNGQLVSYKKYLEMNNQPKLNDTTNLLQQQMNSRPDGSGVAAEIKLEEPDLMSIMSMNSVHQTISTQVNEQELYQFNDNVFEESNRLGIEYTNSNEIYSAPKPNQLISYTNESNSLSNMCNVTTQMPSIPPSPINQKDNPFTSQFVNQLSNQMMNDKVDFNNNNSLPSGLSYPSFNDEQQIAQLNNCQVNNNPMNQLTNQTTNQKMFVNPQNLMNKNNNRPLQQRVRHSSGPSSHPYNLMVYNNNNAFVPTNSSLTNIRSNSLSPLYENCVDNLNPKINNFNANNFANTSNNSTIAKFSSNPVSPVSEPMSPNFNNIIFDNKKQQLHNLRFNPKFNNLNNQLKKDGSRSASFTSSNSNESFASTGRTRHRHMSSPYIGTMMANSGSNSNNSNFPYSSQSLTNSPTAPVPSFNSGDVFLQNNTINQSMNQAGINHQGNLPEGNYLVSLVASNKNGYEFPPSPPLSSTILNEEKTFKKSNDLVTKNNLLQQEEWTNRTMMNLQQNQPFNQSNTIQQQPLVDQSIQPIDDLQTTLNDLKDCDKDFSKFF